MKFKTLVLAVIISFGLIGCDDDSTSTGGRVVEEKYRFVGGYWEDSHFGGSILAIASLGENTFTVSDQRDIGFGSEDISFSYTNVYTQGSFVPPAIEGTVSGTYLYSNSQKIGTVISISRNNTVSYIQVTLGERGNNNFNSAFSTNIITSDMQNEINGNAFWYSDWEL